MSTSRAQVTRTPPCKPQKYTQCQCISRSKTQSIAGSLHQIFPASLNSERCVLADLKLRVIEFSLAPPDACQTRTRNQITPHLLHADERLVQRAVEVASLDRTESFIKTTEGQVRCIVTAEFEQTGVNVAWNVSYINAFHSSWMVPRVYHSLRGQEIKCRLLIWPCSADCSISDMSARLCQLDSCSSIFSRPTPSWLPPGRSTRSIACCKLGCKG